MKLNPCVPAYLILSQAQINKPRYIEKVKSTKTIMMHKIISYAHKKYLTIVRYMSNNREVFHQFLLFLQ